MFNTGSVQAVKPHNFRTLQAGSSDKNPRYPLFDILTGMLLQVKIQGLNTAVKSCTLVM